MDLSFAPAVAVGIFAAVIVAIATNRMHMTVAAALGAVILLVTGVLSAQQTSETINPGEDTIALFFGGMVMARTLIPTGLFEFLGAIALRLVRGEGKRLLIAIVAIAAPICAFLPNATVVILLAPLIVGLCQKMKIDFAPPVMLLVFVANTAGLLTLVGDPATFIVGSSINLSFNQYLRLLSPGGLLALVSLIAILPLTFRSIWQARIRRVFERVVGTCIEAGLVGGEGFAVDASLIEADANRQRSISPSKNRLSLPMPTTI
jgi:Na+/H+ antiporter NhaD/arsenite permease-like protein